MSEIISFNTILHDAEMLTLEEQETLTNILHKRIMAKRRLELAEESQEAYREYLDGNVKPATPEDLMNEIIL